MKTGIVYLGIVLCFMQGYAQVGINTTTPAAQLQIKSTNQAIPANTDGLLIPKVDVFPAANPTVAQQGMMVYLTTTSGLNAPGFYYWNNPTASWIGFSTSGNDKAWYEEATTVTPDAITDDMYHTGNVAIGKLIADYPLEIQTTAFNTGIRNDFTATVTNATPKIAMHNVVTANSSDITYGNRNEISGTGNGAI
jgi:hypothetical protein